MNRTKVMKSNILLIPSLSLWLMNISALPISIPNLSNLPVVQQQLPIVQQTTSQATSTVNGTLANTSINVGTIGATPNIITVAPKTATNPGAMADVFGDGLVYVNAPGANTGNIGSRI